MLNDYVNMLFLIGASGFTVLNISRLYKDKHVQGVCVTSQVFFFVWTLFSLYFFYDLKTYASMVAEGVLSVTTLVYFVMMMYYKTLDNLKNTF